MSTKTKKLPAFNRKNAEAFGRSLYSDQGGVVSFLKLCDGTLRNGKDGGRTLHCVIGEAYAQFIEPSVKTPYQKATVKMEGEYGPYEGDYQSKYYPDGSDAETGFAIDELVVAAQLKSPSVAAKKRLAVALNYCVDSNDETDNEFERAELASETWLKRVVPLLK